MSDDQSVVLEQWVIYSHPSDYPDQYVVRRWEIGDGWMRATADVQAWDTLDDARLWSVPADRVRIERDPSDDPTIVEIWT